jgi:EmrB/QacA subfamily drug resistance transporter
MRRTSSGRSTTSERGGTATLVLCCLAQYMVVLDVSIVNVALPSISADLGFDPVELQWVVNAYTLAFAGFLLLGGRAADVLGRREAFAGGLALFAVASLAGGLAQDEWTLVVARAAQGLGGAVLTPATLAILTTSFAEGAERNRALGLWGAMGAIGGASGALVGGVLTTALSWRWILFINVPIGLLGALAALRAVRTGRAEPGARRAFDLTGALVVTSGLVVLTYGIVGAERAGWGSARTLGLLGAGVALLLGFLAVERRAAAPLVPLRIFRSRLVSGANLVVFCLGGAVFAMWYFVSLHLQQVLGFSPLEAGLALGVMPLAIAVCTQAAIRLTGRLGPGPVLTGGMLLIGTGMLALGGVDTGGSWPVDVLIPATVTAAGIGFAFVPVTIAATSGVRRGEAGLASGLVNTSRQMGGSLGLALLATVASGRTADLAGRLSRGQALTEGFGRAFALGGAIALAGAAISLALLVRAPRHHAPLDDSLQEAAP